MVEPSLTTVDPLPAERVAQIEAQRDAAQAEAEKGAGAADRDEFQDAQKKLAEWNGVTPEWVAERWKATINGGIELTGWDKTYDLPLVDDEEAKKAGRALTPAINLWGRDLAAWLQSHEKWFAAGFAGLFITGHLGGRLLYVYKVKKILAEQDAALEKSGKERAPCTACGRMFHVRELAEGVRCAECRAKGRKPGSKPPS